MHLQFYSPRIHDHLDLSPSDGLEMEQQHSPASCLVVVFFFDIPAHEVCSECCADHNNCLINVCISLVRLLVLEFLLKKGASSPHRCGQCGLNAVSLPSKTQLLRSSLTCWARCAGVQGPFPTEKGDPALRLPLPSPPPPLQTTPLSPCRVSWRQQKQAELQITSKWELYSISWHLLFLCFHDKTLHDEKHGQITVQSRNRRRIWCSRVHRAYHLIYLILVNPRSERKASGLIQNKKII